MTTIERLPFTATGGHSAELPKLARFDQLESAGSLMLIDPTHPLNPWAAGVPANDAVVPNVVETLALAAIGSATPGHVRPVMKRGAAFSGSAGLVERTPKGALHAISPQSGAAVSGSGPAIALPVQLIKYLLDHSKGDAQNHQFYASIWLKPTRFATAGYGNSSAFGINGNGQQTNSTLFNAAIPQNNTAPLATRPNSGTPARLGALFAPAENTGAALGVPRFLALGAARWNTNISGVPQTAAPISQPGDGTQQGTTGTAAGGSISFGSSTPVPGIGATGTLTSTAVIDPTSASGNKDKAGSWAFMRFYLEDLTVSGRTFDDVAALDYAMYTREVLTAGGRYYADTYTDPATLP